MTIGQARARGAMDAPVARGGETDAHLGDPMGSAHLKVRAVAPKDSRESAAREVGRLPADSTQ
jgi:hypothetical protein